MREWEKDRVGLFECLLTRGILSALADRALKTQAAHEVCFSRSYFQNPVTSGRAGREVTFKTLSHLGGEYDAFLQNPVTSGMSTQAAPSKPCHIWDS